MKLNILLLAVLIMCVVACVSPTEMQQTWSNPQQKADSTKLFQKILFVAFLKDPSARKIAEDKLVQEVNGRGVASYNYLNTDTNKELLSQRLKNDGFDGIVVMRMITLDKRSGVTTTGTVPSNYNSWYGYYSSAFPAFTDQSNSINNVYNIETNVYSLAADKLLWSGVTHAVNISDTGKMIDKVIAAVKQRMKSEGFIK
jgi:hypothetical protein